MNRQSIGHCGIGSRFTVVCVVLALLVAPAGYASEPASHGAAATNGHATTHEPAAAAHGPAAATHGSATAVPSSAHPTAADKPKAAGHGTEAPAGPTADEVISMLKGGNGHFLAGKLQHPNSDGQRRADTAVKGQKPIVTIVSCSDSRVPVELIFDRGVGELFVIRVAGNVCDTDEIGSAEYGVDHLGTPVLLVMGHTRCGAVTAVATGAQLHGHIGPLVENIKPAVDTARKAHPDLSGEAIVPYAIQTNIFQGIEDILTKSPVIAERVKAGKARVEGALYDIAEGKIEWLGPHPRQKELLEQAKNESLAGHMAAPASRPTDSHAAAGATPHAGQPSVSTAVLADAVSASARTGAPSHGQVQAPSAAAAQVAGWIPARPPQTGQGIGTAPRLLERCLAEEMYRQGAMHLQAGEYAQAAGRFRAATEIDPSMLAAKSDLAGVYCVQQKYDKALDMYMSILAIDAQYGNALQGAALCHASLKQYDQSKAMLQKLIKLDAHDARAWLELGDVSCLSGDVESAQQQWRTAAETNPSAQEIIGQAQVRLRAYSTRNAVDQSAER